MALDTSYRTWPAADLAAMRVSILTQLKQIEGVGQNHSLNGRNTNQASFAELTDKLTNVNAAIDWQASLCDRGNKGYASRYACFGGPYGGGYE